MGKQQQYLQDSKDPDMISFNTCKRILNSNGNQYTDEEIHKIREYLYQLAEIQYRHFEQWRAGQLNVQSENKIDSDSENMDAA